MTPDDVVVVAVISAFPWIWMRWRQTPATVPRDTIGMEQDRHVNSWGLTGDPEEDRKRKRVALNRIEQMRKDYNFVQIDLLGGNGSNVRPAKNIDNQFKKDRKTVMVALALGLHEHIPEQMARKFGFTSKRSADTNPPTPREDTSKAPF